jgi:threonine/homoserine/homoserine lactone efflux protein
MEAFLAGVVAGYGIAIPVGAIAVLIVEVGIRCGFRCAFFAGAGAATADLIYAALAVIGGAAIAALVQTINHPLRVASAAVLIVIAVVGLRRVGRQQESVEIAMPDRRELAGTYARFVGLTVINPATIVYFGAVIVGLGVASDMTVSQGILFAVGAFLASLSWQTLLALFGGFAGDRLSDRARTVAVVVGNLVILAFAVVILFG